MDFMINYAEKSISKTDCVVSPGLTDENQQLIPNDNVLEQIALETGSIVAPLEIPETSEVQAKNLPRGRCFLCKRSKDKKVKTTCFSCETLVCSTHSKHITVCIQCEGNFSF